MTNQTVEIINILFLAAFSFVIAIGFVPIMSYFLYKYRLGKKIRKDQPIFSSLHQKKAGTPTMGGVLIWGTTLFLTLFFALMTKVGDGLMERLNFLSRKETYLPLAMLVLSGIVGATDDLIGIFGKTKEMGFRMRHRAIIYCGVALIGGLWFFYKLGWDVARIPFIGNFDIGILYVLVFVFILFATAFSVNEADGLDGLAGGVLVPAFGSQLLIAFVQGKYELASFIAVLMGALLAFLWFNVGPARFFMGDTGAMSLGMALGVIAMLTNTFLLLPFFGFVLVVESLSVIIQMTSKKLFKRKVFLSSPIHHHFEAIGWPESKIVMRLWIISWIAAIIGLIIWLLERQL